MENFTYPRVTLSTTARARSSVGPAVEDTTILFAPIIAERGPVDEVVVCHTLSEFIDVFGDLDYKSNKLQAFNVYNWLSNGGTVYAKRLVFPGADVSTLTKSENGVTKVTWAAKYPGEWYNDIQIVITARNITGGNYFDIVVKHVTTSKTTVLETFYRVSDSKFKSIIDKSRYITVGEGVTSLSAGTIQLSTGAGSDGESDTLKSLDDLIYSYFSTRAGAEEQLVGSAEKDLGNKLEMPIDIILDAGFSERTKEAILKFVTGLSRTSSDVVGPNLESDECIRPDIIAIFDEMVISSDSEISETNLFSNVKATNIAVYSQYFTIFDAIFSDKNVKVGPSYFLSRLIPYNDLQYGIQFPTAGLRRGVLADALDVNLNPRPQEKEDLFKRRVNYVEKTSREYAFMSQRTHDGSTEVSYTALSFLNNSRCLEKMKKELERLGRDYLFEFNDAVTLGRLSNILNKYMGNWVSNRTLSFANVDVQPDEYSSEKVNILLSIRFTGTIEVISVDIVIE